jgi:hypothetical protein
MSTGSCGVSIFEFDASSSSLSATSTSFISFCSNIDSGLILPLNALAKLVRLEYAIVASLQALLSNGTLDLPPAKPRLPDGLE